MKNFQLSIICSRIKSKYEGKKYACDIFIFIVECKIKALFDMKRNSLLLNVFYLNIKNITYNKMQENFKFNGIALQFY